MLKKLSILIILLAALAACTPDETAEPAELPPAESTSESAVNPVEEPVEEPKDDEESNSNGPESGQSENPDVITVDPSGSVDLGEVSSEAPSEEDGDLIVQPAPGVPDPEVKMTQIASQHLADWLGIDIGEVTFVEAIAQDWPDSSLGCPSPDALYAAVITPGYEIILEAEGQSYTYHTDSVEQVVLCIDGLPAE